MKLSEIARFHENKFDDRIIHKFTDIACISRVCVYVKIDANAHMVSTLILSLIAFSLCLFVSLTQLFSEINKLVRFSDTNCRENGAKN